VEQMELIQYFQQLQVQVAVEEVKVVDQHLLVAQEDQVEVREDLL